MFGTKHNECVGFESRWKVKKISFSSASQTTKYASNDSTTNTTDRAEIEVQTEIEEPPTNVDTDMTALANWMKKIYPLVKKELDYTSNCNVFKGYKLSSDTTDITCKLVQNTEVFPNNESADVMNTNQISSVSWNSTGKTLAVSCSFTHQTWCYDTGQILIYTLDRDGKFPENPNKKISCESCVTIIRFHPQLPALFAGGTYSGGINVWNCQQEKGCELLVSVKDLERITHLSWMTLDYITSNVIFLVSSSIEGMLTLWRLNNTNTSIYVYEKYKIKPPLFTKTVKETNNIRGKGTLEVVFGITSFDFSKLIPEMFVVGLEGGLVVQCSMSKPTKLKGSTDVQPIYDPVYKYYEPHEGSVISISFSPNNKDMFMTTGMDLQVRIYLIGQEDPARVIFLKNSANPLQWVPHEDHIIVGYGLNGEIEVYDIIKGKIINSNSIQLLDNRTTASMEINPTKLNTVAVALNTGVLQLWNIPWNSFANLIESR